MQRIMLQILSPLTDWFSVYNTLTVLDTHNTFLSRVHTHSQSNTNAHTGYSVDTQIPEHGSNFAGDEPSQIHPHMMSSYVNHMMSSYVNLTQRYATTCSLS